MRRITLRFIVTAIGLSLCFTVITLFVTGHFGGNSRDENFQSAKCDCPSALKAAPKIIRPVANVTSNRARSSQCKEVQQSSPVQRAIIIFYPHHQSEYFFPEVRW
jgi:hypothetical protein